MKGLLLKDWYILFKTYKIYLVIIVGLGAISAFLTVDAFTILIPVLCAVLIYNLMTSDEQSGWITYSETMPYSRRDAVLGKYVVLIIMEIGAAIVVGASRVVKMLIESSFDIRIVILLAVCVFFAGIISGGLMLPFMFRYGTQKGKLVYFVFVGLAVMGISMAANSLNIVTVATKILSHTCLLAATLLIASLVLYSLSLLISIKLFQTRVL